MSTVGVFSTVGEKSLLFEYLHSTEHPYGNYDIPHMYHEIPHGSQITKMISSTFIMISPTVLNTPMVLKISPMVLMISPTVLNNPANGTKHTLYRVVLKEL